MGDEAGGPPWEPQSLWREWARHAAEHAAFHPSVLEHVPWHALTDAELDQVLGALFRALHQPADEWLVVFRLRGMTAAVPSVYLGGITVYDPTALDYGEGELFRSGRSDGRPSSMPVSSCTPTAPTRPARRRGSDSTGRSTC
jgi:hypothetical protein